MKSFLLLLSLLTLKSAYALIGGDLATSRQYRSTVFNGSCTGAKIAPRKFLFAAHCFIDNETKALTPEFAPRSRMNLKTHYGTEYAVTLENIYVHPSYINELVRLGRRWKINVGGGSFDVAIVKVKENTPNIPQGTIDYSPIQLNDPVVIGGYGCEKEAKRVYPQRSGRYKIYTTNVEATPHVKFIENADALKFERYNYFTPGNRMDASAASLCPGDSGGPVYRPGTRSIVAVNSSYLFTDRSAISYVNAHAKLNLIKSWIESVPQ